MKQLPASRIWAAPLLIGCLSAVSAHAADSYIGLGGGISYAPDSDLSDLGAVIDYDIGFRVGTLVFGRRFDNGWRADIEASYRRNELETVRFEDNRPPLNTGTHDSTQALSLMINGTYEFDLNLPLAPYIGVGAGPSTVFYEITDYFSHETVLDDDATTLAYQVYAGVMIPVGERWQIAADYRWWQTIDFDMTLESGESISLDHTNRLFSLNFRRLLGESRNGSPGEPLPAESDRWYLDARVGTAIAADSDIDNRFDTNFDAFDPGVAATLAFGYSHIRPSGRRLRAEVELQGWENDADVLDLGMFLGEFPMDGSVKVRGASLNALIDLAPNWKIRPHAGLGVGYAEVDYDVLVLGDNGFEPYVDDKHTGISLQGILGFGVRMTERTELSFSYRYWLAPSVDLIDPEGEALETEHGAHLIMLGLRFGLGG